MPRENLNPKLMIQLIVIANQKSGVGTPTTLNLEAALAERSHRLRLVAGSICLGIPRSNASTKTIPS